MPGYCYYDRLHLESKIPDISPGFPVKLFTTLLSGCHFDDPERPPSLTKFENFGPCIAQVRRPDRNVQEIT
jgi:hypothetical protein